MHIGLLPIVFLLPAAIAALAMGALIRTIGERRVKGLTVGSHAIVLMARCTVLWLGLCFFFMLLASLGHSVNPLCGSWPHGLVSFLVLIVATATLLVWLVKRKSG
jgi:formate-dependent nitrite reductase membrane component NrfD